MQIVFTKYECYRKKSRYVQYNKILKHKKGENETKKVEEYILPVLNISGSCYRS